MAIKLQAVRKAMKKSTMFHTSSKLAKAPKITITPGTQPGKVLRMRGKGLPVIDQYARQYGTGDLLINVGVYIPENLNKEEKALIEKLQNSEHIRPGGADKKNFFKNLFG